MQLCCVACRLFKEKQMYEKEVVDQEEKVEKMKVDGKDEYDIKKQVTVTFYTVKTLFKATLLNNYVLQKWSFNVHKKMNLYGAIWAKCQVSL